MQTPLPPILPSIHPPRHAPPLSLLIPTLSLSLYPLVRLNSLSSLSPELPTLNPKTDEHDIALGMLRKAEILAGPEDLVAAVTYNNLACYYRRKGKLRTALSYLQQVNPTRYTLHTTHYTLHTTHYTLHTTNYALHTTHYTPHITHYTLFTTTLQHTTHYTLHTTLHTPITHFTLRTTHHTLHTTHYTLKRLCTSRRELT